MIVDTIAAISTAPGMGAIGIIRVSGTQTIPICLHFLFSSNNQKFTQEELERNHRRMVFSEFKSSDKLIDKIVFAFFKGPNSYTGEDLVEFHFHGNGILLKQALNEIFKMGARPAEPGEFTKRAYLNGKLNLPEAEAIGRLIHSRSQFELELAQKNFFGEISKLSSRLRSELVGIKAECEAEIDFSTEDLTFESLEERRGRIAKIRGICNNLLSKAARAETMIGKSKVVLFGEPNVGKSSLMNVILGRERSIISDRPGTTRDFISEDLNLKGVPIQLVDTAGVRETEDEIERKGIQQSMRESLSANLRLFLIDSSKSWNFSDFVEKNISYLSGTILLANKIDIADASWSTENTHLEFQKLDLDQAIQILEISCKTGQGIPELIQILEERLTTSDPTEEYILLEDRQKYHFQMISDCLAKADELMLMSAPAEIVVKEIDEALRQVGTLLGAVSNEEVLGRIFSTFCVGK